MIVSNEFEAQCLASSAASLLRWRLETIVGECYFSFPISGTDKFLQILRASTFEISEWRGTASTAPVS